ncbi:MAG: hypothetical protein H6732_03685 [Alphaproteobacteria bacterium]|nr:hypothetical protein [Alphaproteobacteria bacterium]
MTDPSDVIRDGEHLDVAQLRDMVRARGDVVRTPELSERLAARAVRAGALGGLLAAVVAWPASSAVWAGELGVGLATLVFVPPVWIAAGGWAGWGAHPALRERDAAAAGTIAGLTTAALAAVVPLVSFTTRGALLAPDGETRLQGLAWLVGMGPWAAAIALAAGAGLGTLAGAQGARLAVPPDDAPVADRARMDDWRTGIAGGLSLPLTLGALAAGLALVVVSARDGSVLAVRVGAGAGTFAVTGVVLGLALPLSASVWSARRLARLVSASGAHRERSDRSVRWLTWLLLVLALPAPAVLLGAGVGVLEQALQSPLVAQLGGPVGLAAMTTAVAVVAWLARTSWKTEFPPQPLDPPMGALLDGALLGGVIAQVGAAAPVAMGVAVAYTLRHQAGGSPEPALAALSSMRWTLGVACFGLPLLTWAWWASTVDALGRWWMQRSR